MSRKKLHRFAELNTFPNIFQNFVDIKGKWNADFFKNNNPITLELACGKGEYSIALAQRFPQRNFIGVDIKGARLWKGAKIALEQSLRNVAFLRIQIENITDFFDKNEVDEIWIIFPDTFPKKSKANKRLTAPRFLNKYKQIIRAGGLIHLKTDEQNLFEYTLETLKAENGKIHEAKEDLYRSPIDEDLLIIKTTYERKHLEAGKTIKYVRFKVN